MNNEMQQGIQRFLFNLSTEDWAGADTELKNLIDQKYQERFDQEYSAVKEHSEQKK